MRRPSDVPRQVGEARCISRIELKINRLSMSPVLAQNRKQLCRWLSFKNANELEQAAVTQILNIAQAAIDDKGSFHIVLAGGTTPKKVYEALRHAKTSWA